MTPTRASSAELAARYQAADKARRRLTGSNATTTHAHTRHTTTLRTIEQKLRRNGHHTLESTLRAEAEILDQIKDARSAGTPDSQLSARRRAAARQIARLLADRDAPTDWPSIRPDRFNRIDCTPRGCSW